MHNLKGIDLSIPRDNLVVITGLSGSGKSSLAFDTIYAEGQRRYVESLSSYARLFLGQMQKPNVDSIEGLSPTIAIDQKTTSRNPRSTVGTVTEIYDYLRLLYARCGDVHCPSCGKKIEQQTVDQMVERILEKPEGTRLILMGPIVRSRKGEYAREIKNMRAEGFVRARIDGEMIELADLPEDYRLDKKIKHDLEVVVDRLVIREGIRSRLVDSLETALRMGKGLVTIEFQEPNGEEYLVSESTFSQNFACVDCDIDIGEVSPRLFSFNNPLGACPECSGLGEFAEIDPELVIFDPKLSLNDGCIQSVGWNFSDRKSWARCYIEALAKKYDFSLDMPWEKLPKKIKDLILFGNGGEKLVVDTRNSRYSRGKDYVTEWIGVVPSMNQRYHQTQSDDMKEFYEDYVSVRACPSCHRARLKPEALAVKIGDLNIFELCTLPIAKAREHLLKQKWTVYQEQIAAPILRELDSRLGFLVDVGLDYLNLARAAATLSGGEAQRIRLATQIGSGLMGVIYVLDEPSIGLHQRDNHRLIETLLRLRDLGNTVIVVEHDEDTIRAADFIVDVGPGAGEYGGVLVAAGDLQKILDTEESITGQYLSGKREIEIPKKRRPVQHKEILELKGCRTNNLKNIDVKVPLKVFTCVTGVSGSGKSSLVNGIIKEHLTTELNRARKTQIDFDGAKGLENLDKIISIDQSPIGRTPRSNPATYTGVFDDIRRLFAGTREAKTRGYKPGQFSFNVAGGRCEACKGDGVNKIEMHFLPDVYVECEVCHGKRYKRETLEVRYKDLNIADVLDLTVEEALTVFENVPSIKRKLTTLMDVGLGYIRLGQPSTQLSGGEAQRVKLSTELAKRQTGKTFYILDEPTTGLHTADVHRLVDILQNLTDHGNTVLVIEHNLDVIKTADYVIDLGPEGGDGGGQVVAVGTPEEVAEVPTSFTGQFLKKILHSK